VVSHLNIISRIYLATFWNTPFVPK
jgi:hypothetical protein